MNIQEHYANVYRFNNIAGNTDNVDEASIAAQVKVIVEEVKELEKAFAEKNAVEMLDGVCDAFVTVVGLMQKMEAAGFKVDEALQRVCDNNMSKFPDYIDDCADQHYAEQGWNIFQNYEYDCFVLKDQNGKIRKPLGFMPVKLGDLVPNNVFGGAA